MFSDKRSWATIIAVCLMAGVIGCNGGDSTEATNGGTPENGEGPAGGANGAGGNDTNVDSPAPAKIPETLYTDTVGKTHLVKVGDAMPDAELPDTGGNLHTLSDLYGEKLTIILFWKDRNLYSVDEFEDLEGDVAAP